MPFEVIGPSSWNATANMVPMQNSFSIGISVAIVIGMAVALFLAFYSVEYLMRVINALEKVIRSVKYVLYGIAITTVFYVAYIVVDRIRFAAAPVDPMIFGYGIAGYIIFYVIGRIGEVAVTKMLQTVREYNNRPGNIVVSEQVLEPGQRMS